MKNVLEYLEHSAQLFAQKPAVYDTEKMCTYGELLGAAKSIGTALAGMAPPRTPVAVFLDKSVEALSAILGVAYAGCFYVSLSGDQPLSRIQKILDAGEIRFLLTDSPERLEGLEFGGTVISCREALDTPADEELLRKIREQSMDIDPLYCNFTSGSTGIPKGVVVSHRSVIDFMDYFPNLFHITSDDVIGNQAPFDFDVSVKDIYSSLKVGAALVLIPRKHFSVITRLMDTLCDYKITTLIWAVSALCLVGGFKGFEYRVPTSVNKVLFSGEMMPIKYLKLWRDHLPEAAFTNLYGPTEITCNCTYHRIDRDYSLEEQIPIGRPFPNEKVFLLDEEDRLITAPRVSGEICVSGTALALGYYNNPEQTAKVFVQNPLNKNYLETICRTGDLAFYDEDGKLYFCGRKDFQIKYMGHRIELEEIETAMNSRPEVTRACCGFDRRRNRLVAFYSGELEPRELKKSLYAVLPEYMIPAIFQREETLPLTSNGKIDRKQLMSRYGEAYGK